MALKHNCIRSNNFEWEKISEFDILKCITCGRRFKEYPK